MGSFVCLSCLLPSDGHDKVKNDSSFAYSCWRQQSVSHSLGKIFRSIWKVLFRSFRKCYRLLNYDSNEQYADPLMVISKTSTLENAVFFISTLNISQTATPKHTIFWKNSGRCNILCSQSDTNLVTIPSIISSVKKYFSDPDLLPKKNGL